MIGYRLKRARLAAGMSQEALGLAAGIEPETASKRVSHYETGRSEPQFVLACRFADVLKVPESYFYTRDDEFAEEILKIYRRKKAAKA